MCIHTAQATIDRKDFTIRSKSRPHLSSVRDQLVDAIFKDVVGPRWGPNEHLPKSEDPTVGYLSGILYPAAQHAGRRGKSADHHKAITSEDDIITSDPIVDADSDDGPDPAAYSMDILSVTRPSSFGMTCQVAKDTQKVRAKITYGTYSLIPKPGGRKNSRVFARTQHEDTFELDTQTNTAVSIPLSANPDYMFKYYIKRRHNGVSLSVFVINTRPYNPKESDQTEAEHCIFQPTITLSAPKDSNIQRIFVDTGLRMGAISEDAADAAFFDMLFRNAGNFALGHGCAVQWDESEVSAVSMLKTTFAPRHTLPAVRPRKVDLECLLMSRLYGISEISEYRKLLSPLADIYEEWIRSDLEPRIQTLPEQFKPAAAKQLEQCMHALGRIRRGIELISTDAMSAGAFEFANRAMYLQRSHIVWSQENQERGKVHGIEPPIRDDIEWRPFQLAFFLLNIESITDPASDDRSMVDLLWFPTGGGKTEAYMGVIAFTIAYRRLRNADTEHRRYGTSVIMRYTLRLLTLQQFHRASTLMCACEYIRKRDEQTWGDESFLLGLWVGRNVTPNKIDGPDGALAAIKAAQKGDMPKEHNPIQIISCPWCGSKIDAYCYRIKGVIRQCRIYCPNKSCDFSQQHNDSGLPVLVVDEDIYRRCPALIIGTVDKFAQMAWKWNARSIFGNVDRYCEKHGFVTSHLADESCGNHRDAESFEFSKYGAPRLEPPELIIQDELHLISGPLGTMTGLYETAIDILCSAEGKKPKIIASTATTRRSHEQIHDIFNRRTSMIFPPQGIDFGDSFFAQTVPLSMHPGKTYFGVCAPAKNKLNVLGRISAVILQEIRMLETNAKASNSEPLDTFDPYHTLVSYFNTIRELGGASRMYEDTAPRYMRRLAANRTDPRVLTDDDNYDDDDSDKNQHGTSTGQIEALEKKELTSRIYSAEIPSILRDLGTEISESVKPIDLLLCTNMLSVGVDIPRLSAMIVNGQPKNHSEYIQATGRIGRQTPGLVVTIFNHLKPRDLSHYENFGYYHATLHGNVEPANVTPFAPRARDKALFGVLVSLVRMSEQNLAKNPDAKKFDPDIRYISNMLVNIRQQILERVKNIDNQESEQTARDLEFLIRGWHAWAAATADNKSENTPLEYHKTLAKSGTKRRYLMRSAAAIGQDQEAAFKTVPNSLRDAEPNIKFWYIMQKDSQGM